MIVRLLAARRFAPLFATQFLGAFNDNFYKTAMLFLITFSLLAGDTAASAQLVTVAGGVFILPFFLFSALAGQLADAYDKARLIRIIKAAEVAIMLVGAAALTLGSVPLMMAVLFAMGLHSTFFGPIKYAILPQHLPPAELLAGTGLVEAGTFIAILTGQIAGGLLPAAAAAWGIVIVAVLGYAAGRQVQPAPPPAGGRRIDWNIAAASYRIMRTVIADPQLGRAVLAVSWFWSVGAVFTSLFVPLVKGSLAGSETVATVFLTVFSVGVAAGSITVARLLKGAISVRYAPPAALLMTLFITDLYFAVRGFEAPLGVLGAARFVAEPAAWRILFDLFGMAAAAGAFIVPLYALLQTASDPSVRSRTIAANNIVNSGFMVAAALGAGVLLSLGLDVPQILLAVGALNLLIILPCLKIGRLQALSGSAA